MSMSQHFSPADRLDFRIGDYARDIESGWIGKILAFELYGVGEDAEVVAKMMGVDLVANLAAGLSREDSLAPEDVQWFAPADLVPA